MSQPIKVPMAKSRLLPFAYSLNPELIGGGKKEMMMMEDDAESMSDEEVLMEGAGHYIMHVHKNRVVLSPSHLKSLMSKKEIILKPAMMSGSGNYHLMVTKKMHRRIMRAHEHDKGIRIGAHHGEYGGLLMDETCRVPQLPATPYDKDQIPAIPTGDAMSSHAYKEATKYAVMKGGAFTAHMDEAGRAFIKKRTLQGKSTKLQVGAPATVAEVEAAANGAPGPSRNVGILVGQGKKMKGGAFIAHLKPEALQQAKTNMRFGRPIDIQTVLPHGPGNAYIWEKAGELTGSGRHPAMKPFIPISRDMGCHTV
jgi:hypothetical protein